jgi:hypothetical protein
MFGIKNRKKTIISAPQPQAPDWSALLYISRRGAEKRQNILRHQYGSFLSWSE